MADYTPILDTQTDPDAPLTSDLAKAWAENPVAIAEGAVDAPKIAGAALGDMYKGLYTLGNAAGALIPITGLDRVRNVYIRGVPDTFTGPRANLRFEFSSNGGSTWSGSQVINPTNVKFELTIALNSGTGSYWLVSEGENRLLTGTFTIPANCNAIRITNPTAATGTSWGGLFVYSVRGVTP